MRITILLLLVLFAAIEAEARLRDYVNVERFTSRNLGTWSAGDGDRIWTQIHCVASSNYNDRFSDPPPARTPPAVHELYDFQIFDQAPAAGYFFYLDDDNTNVGNARLSASFEHRDVKVGTPFETLTDGVYSSNTHTGQFRDCNNGDNSEVKMTILETELENARAGLYRGRFRAEAIGGSSGTRTHGRNLVMTLRISEIVRISSLDNVLLGPWGGSGDLSGDETFCVYSNNDSAGYTISFSSPNESGGVFRLSNGSGTEFVDYQLEFADSVGGAGSAVGTGSLVGNGSNSASDCGSVDNARLSVSVSEANLGSATPDSYSDTVTILVAPL